MSRSDSTPRELVNVFHIANSIGSLVYAANLWFPTEAEAMEFAGAVRKHLEAAAALIEACAAKHREFIRESADREDEYVAMEIAGLRANLKGVRFTGLDKSFIGEQTRAFYRRRSDKAADKAIAEMPPIDIDGFKLGL